MPKAELPHTLQGAIEDYNAWADRYMRSVERRHAIQKPLYHYTDANGLKGIIENQEIWFTDFRYLNDPSELSHGMNLAHGVIAKGVAGASWIKHFYAMLGGMFSIDNFSDHIRFFIASFSRDRDELGQWRAYADNGRGFALGLSPKLFAPDDPLDKDPLKNLVVGPIVYDNAATKRRQAMPIKKAHDILAKSEWYASKHLNNGKILRQFLDNLARYVIASPLIWNCLVCKHPAYKSENEVRLIILGLSKLFKGRVPVRIRKGEVVPYIPRQLPLHTPGNIVEIVIGPAAPLGTEEGVRALLDKFKINAPIRRSTIPYRPV
ncbi:DUF2971 domain-containing protein [Bradyrhizobium sp. 200]|uniref:DUF2971 domain-containing protein n=1 Tax=Bradyrhizobium sp. 200 TaxID=2782665 RepID=UPI001FFF91CC|nr:DUF2971 domain-containing protein [Bradyrhizobium sp. 200]UPJ50250.1 DUF2971 domain-containing protein [Bradyrhizobium sp. 200]